MKRIFLIVLTAIVVLFNACAKKPQTSEVQAVQSAKLETLKISVVDEFYEATGTVRAKNTSVIAARIIGTITRVHVREGDRVRAGQILFEIENREAQPQVAKAEAGARESADALEEVQRNIRAAESARIAAQASEKLANTTFNRYQTLFERHSVSPQEFDEVRTKLEIARAESERAERMLQSARARQNQMLARIDQAKADVTNARIYAGYSRLSSPINGIVVAKQTDVGSMATPGTPLLTIENDSSYQLEVAVEESQLSKIRVHDQARVEIEAVGSTELVCSVQEIVPAADPNTRSYTVKVALPNIAGAQLRSGLYGKARFISGQRQVLTIPKAAVTERGQLTSVFVVDQTGVARLRLIKTGKTYGERVEILSGLSDGEQIVVDNSQSIRDGSRVRDMQQVAGR